MCHVVQVCVEGCYACESAVRGNLCLVKLLLCWVPGFGYCLHVGSVERLDARSLWCV